MPPQATKVTVLQAGAAKANPFTIVIVANPALEVPLSSRVFLADTVVQADFDQTAQYIYDSLFGRPAGQVETLLGDPTIAPQVRVVTLFKSGLTATAANSLLAQDSGSYILFPRQA